MHPKVPVRYFKCTAKLTQIHVITREEASIVVSGGRSKLTLSATLSSLLAALMLQEVPCQDLTQIFSVQVCSFLLAFSW